MSLAGCGLLAAGCCYTEHVSSNKKTEGASVAVGQRRTGRDRRREGEVAGVGDLPGAFESELDEDLRGAAGRGALEELCEASRVSDDSKKT